MAADRFPSPFEVPTPDGAEGWESMYDWYHLFGPERRELDEQRFWFADRLHHPDVLHPYDEIQCECWWQALGAFNTRVFAMPPAFGVDQRIVNGRLYVTPVPAPPEDIAARAEEFGKRAGHYYERWDAIYDEWRTKVMAKLEEIRALRFDPLPDLEPEETVYEHTGHSAGFRMIRDFDRLVLTMYETYQYHFELLNIGYAAYLTFFGMCRAAFPDISDQSISRMVGGLRVELYRPDDELKRLAKEAVRLGLADRINATEDAASLFADLRSDAAGTEWVADWERTADPWFLINTDPGHPGGYHTLPDLGRRPEHPAGLGARVPAPARRRDDDRPADRGGPRRARPDHRGLPRAAPRGRARDLRRHPRAGAPGVRLHRGARALHRALDVGDVLGEVPRALAGPGRDGRVRRARGHVLPAPLRGRRGDLRLRRRLVGRARGPAARTTGARSSPGAARSTRRCGRGSRRRRSARRRRRSTSRSR